LALAPSSCSSGSNRSSLATPATPVPPIITKQRLHSNITQHGVVLHLSDTAALVRTPSPNLYYYSATPTKTNSPLPSACIAHNTTILTECTTSASSNTSSLASLILPKIDHSAPQKLTYTHGSHHIHYIASSPSEYPPTQPTAGGLTYLVISDASSVSRRISFGFLVELRRRFLSSHPPETTDFSDLPNYGCGGFNGEMRSLMVEYGTTEQGRDDAIGNVQREIEDVRGIMTRNIEGLLERGERIDLLVDKTDRLGGSAREFRVRSRGLKRQMWWKNVRLMGLMGFVGVLVLVTIVVSVKNSV
jgi:vesicle-associated membrane protein 7